MLLRNGKIGYAILIEIIEMIETAKIIVAENQPFTKIVQNIARKNLVQIRKKS